MAERELVIVSAFITNINTNRDISDYINYGRRLFNNGNTQIIFMESAVFYRYIYDLINISDYEIKNGRFEYETKKYEYVSFHTKYFVLFERDDIYLYNYRGDINDFNVITDNPNKDTLDYMFIQCHKTEWVKMATVLHTHLVARLDAEYMWIDFGIFHMFNGNELLFYESIENLRNRVLDRPNNKIRAASCWSPQMYEIYSDTVYQRIAWLFAGSVFGGSLENISKFADLTKAMCLKIIQEKGHLMWEVNVWALIYQENPELFDLFTCGHDSTILNHY